MSALSAVSWVDRRVVPTAPPRARSRLAGRREPWAHSSAITPRSSYPLSQLFLVSSVCSVFIQPGHSLAEIEQCCFSFVQRLNLRTFSKILRNWFQILNMYVTVPLFPASRRLTITGNMICRTSVRSEKFRCEFRIKIVGSVEERIFSLPYVVIDVRPPLGAAMVANPGMKRHEVMPINWCIRCTVGHSAATHIFSGSVWIPSQSTKYLSWLWQKWHLFGLKQSLASRRRRKTSVRNYRCPSNVSILTMMSSKYTNTCGSSSGPMIASRSL